MELRILQLAAGLRDRYDLRSMHLHAKLTRHHESLLCTADRTVWKGITVKFLMVVPIVNETGAVVGFVSDSDVLRRFAQDNLPVSDISTLITGMARGEFPELSHAPHEPAEVFMGLHDDWDNIDDRLRTRTRGQDGMKHQVERIAA